MNNVGRWGDKAIHTRAKQRDHVKIAFIPLPVLTFCSVAVAVVVVVLQVTAQTSNATNELEQLEHMSIPTIEAVRLLGLRLGLGLGLEAVRLLGLGASP